MHSCKLLLPILNTELTEEQHCTVIILRDEYLNVCFLTRSRGNKGQIWLVHVPHFTKFIYQLNIRHTCIGYEIIDSQLSVAHLIGYNELISISMSGITVYLLKTIKKYCIKHCILIRRRFYQVLKPLHVMFNRPFDRSIGL